MNPSNANNLQIVIKPGAVGPQQAFLTLLFQAERRLAEIVYSGVVDDQLWQSLQDVKNSNKEHVENLLTIFRKKFSHKPPSEKELQEVRSGVPNTIFEIYEHPLAIPGEVAALHTVIRNMPNAMALCFIVMNKIDKKMQGGWGAGEALLLEKEGKWTAKPLSNQHTDNIKNKMFSEISHVYFNLMYGVQEHFSSQGFPLQEVWDVLNILGRIKYSHALSKKLTRQEAANAAKAFDEIAAAPDLHALLGSTHKHRNFAANMVGKLGQVGSEVREIESVADGVQTDDVLIVRPVRSIQDSAGLFSRSKTQEARDLFSLSASLNRLTRVIDLKEEAQDDWTMVGDIPPPVLASKGAGIAASSAAPAVGGADVLGQDTGKGNKPKQ